MSTTITATRSRRDERGFTLLELIVVIGIFALVAAMAYGGLISVLKTRAAIASRLDRTAAYQKAYWIMRDDFQNGVDRPVRDDYGQLQLAFRYTDLDHRVDFTRGGWTNPLDLPRPPLRRVGYFLDIDKKALMRRTWPVLDRAPQTKPVDTVLLKSVDDIRWRFLEQSGDWQDHWPGDSALQAAQTAAAANPAGADNVASSIPPPRAVELTLNTEDWGKLRFVFSYGLQQPGATPVGAAELGTGSPDTSKNVFSGDNAAQNNP